MLFTSGFGAEFVSITYEVYVASDCSGTPRFVTGTTPETKALDQCVNYNEGSSTYEILTCSAPGEITSTKYTDSDCSVPYEVNPDETMVLGSCVEYDGVTILTDWGTSVCQPEEPTDLDCQGTYSECTEACELAGDRTFTETQAQSGSGASCPVATDCAYGEGACVEDLDCQGFYSECTEACELAGDRTFTETQAQSGNGASCPDATDCAYGEGACVEEPGADTTAAAAAETTAAAAAEAETTAAAAETTAEAAAEAKTTAAAAETTAAAEAETTAAAAETTAAAAAETTAAQAEGDAETTAAAAAETTAAAAEESETTAAAKEEEADTTAASEPTKAISMDVVECAEGDKTIVTTCTNLNKPELKDQCTAANGCKWMETPCAVGETNINCVSTVSKKCTLKLDDDSTPEYQPDGSCPIDSGVSTLSFTVIVALVALLW